jgi:homoserine kinase type II
MRFSLDDPRAILSLYPAAEQPLAPPESLGNAGGSSGALLWRFRSGRGQRVLRGWPPDGPGADELARIHGWLRRLEHLTFIPRPLPARDGRTLHEHAGRVWEVAPWLPGTADPEGTPVLSHVRAAFAGLAAWHSALAEDATEGTSPGMAARLAELDRLLLGSLERLELAVRETADDPRNTLALRWIEIARALFPRIRDELRAAAAQSVPLQPCLRDARPQHFLFDGARLSGIVDFGAMGFDTVAADLARLLSEWIGADRLFRNEALTAYSAVQSLDERALRMIPAFERSAALLGGSHWIQWHYLDHRNFEDPHAVDRGLTRALERISLLTHPGFLA